MKKTVLVFGVIGGVVINAIFYLTLPFHHELQNLGIGEVIGYASMVVALSFIFFGIKSYRDNQLGGTISFGKAFQVGILIALVASLLYAIGWEVYLVTVAPDFMADYAAQVIAKAQAAGKTAAELQAITDRMNHAQEMYRNPIVRFGMTFSEIFPVGIVITLASAALLRKKEVLPA
jgi:hypothetical protein